MHSPYIQPQTTPTNPLRSSTNYVYLNPFRATLLANRPGQHMKFKGHATGFKANEKTGSAQPQQLSNNSTNGKLSEHAQVKLRNAIGWMVLLSPGKRVYDQESGRDYEYKVGVVTVTIPSGQSDVDPGFFKSALLKSLLGHMNYQHGVVNYVWKLERQKNGALHAHITVDKYIPWQWLRQVWCKLLAQHGLIDAYRNTFKDLSLRQYIDYRRSQDLPRARAKYPTERDYVNSLIRAYKIGGSSDWSEPNCTDVHSVRQVKNLAAYLTKYMSKDPGLSANYKGRVWSLSHSLSRMGSFRLELVHSVSRYVVESVKKVSTEFKDYYRYSRYLNEVVNHVSVAYLARSAKALFSSPIIGSFLRFLSPLYQAGKVPKGLFFSVLPTGAVSINYQTT